MIVATCASCGKQTQVGVPELDVDAILSGIASLEPAGRAEVWSWFLGHYFANGQALERSGER